jgi:hypothetical protein
MMAHAAIVTTALNAKIMSRSLHLGMRLLLADPSADGPIMVGAWPTP